MNQDETDLPNKTRLLEAIEKLKEELVNVQIVGRVNYLFCAKDEVNYHLFNYLLSGEFYGKDERKGKYAFLLDLAKELKGVKRDLVKSMTSIYEGLNSSDDFKQKMISKIDECLAQNEGATRDQKKILNEIKGNSEFITYLYSELLARRRSVMEKASGAELVLKTQHLFDDHFKADTGCKELIYEYRIFQDTQQWKSGLVGCV